MADAAGMFAPDAAEPGFPYWWEALDDDTEFAPAPPERTDLLVIGAGYTGLSAAIAAHDAGARVAIIDAGRPGDGASTRNGGMVGAHPRRSWDALAQEFGADTADAIFAEAGTALDWLRDLIRREGIACDLQDTGRIQLAYTPAHFRAQQTLADAVNGKSGVTCKVVPKAELASEISTALYHGGILFPEHAALHPAKYHRGLLAAALRREILVVAHCPALTMAREGAMHVVRTPAGEVRAERIVLATNGYTRNPFNWFARRVFPLPSFLIATEPLSANLLGQLAPGRRMMVETRVRHSYFRLSPDGTRIVFGGRAAMVPIDLRTAAQRLHRTMTQIWPSLEGTRLTHVWTGNTGYTFGHMPHVGCHDGIHYALGFSGSGTVLAPYLGAKAAYQALGDPRGETAYSRPELTSRWYHRGSYPFFLHPAEVWFRQVRDRIEDRASVR